MQTTPCFGYARCRGSGDRTYGCSRPVRAASVGVIIRSSRSGRSCPSARAPGRNATRRAAGSPLLAGYGSFHVDEIDHDQSAQVTQPQLPRNLIGRLQIGVQRGLFDVRATRGAGRVHVDRYHCFGMVDDDGAAGRQGDLREYAVSI